jgi:Reverse transcriptase (RNA-dependent DNA polymerase)
MSKNYEFRFEIKPGKFVYVPTEACKEYGYGLNKKILARWIPEPYFYHLRKAGGHVAAMRPHLEKSFHASIDLTKFFTSVSRTRVHRALCKIGFANRQALDIATQSCVEADGRKFLPYGFPQSMMLATLVFEKSALGSVVRMLRMDGIIITIYVDDILVSSNNLVDLQSAYEQVLSGIELSGFEASLAKSEEPGVAINSFNCKIEDRITILDDRMQKFRQQLLVAGPRARDAILRYVGVINSDQALELAPP